VIQFDLLRMGDSSKISIADDLRVDLELDKIIAVASNGDKLISETWSNMLLLRNSSEDVMRYRQEAVRDALANRDVIIKMYSIARDTIERVKRDVFILLLRTDDPPAVARETSRGIRILLDGLEEMLTLLKSSPSFSSTAFREFVSSFTANINDQFISSARGVASIFDTSRENITFSVKIGSSNYLKDPVLLVPREGGSYL